VNLKNAFNLSEFAITIFLLTTHFIPDSLNSNMDPMSHVRHHTISSPSAVEWFCNRLFDTGGYLDREMEMTIYPGRSFLYGLFMIALLGLMSHNSCLALGIGLIITLLLLRVIIYRKSRLISIGILPPVAAVLASLALIPMMNLAISGKLTYSTGGPLFFRTLCASRHCTAMAVRPLCCRKYEFMRCAKSPSSHCR
jgi:hypothetical protein